MNSEQQQQFINDLLVESYEGLDRFDRELLALEKGQGGAETMHAIFRIIHTLKGTSGCLGLKKIQKLAHAGESLLDLIRNDKLSVSGDIITALLKLSDSLRAMLNSIETTGNEGAQEFNDIITVLVGLQTPSAAASAPAAFGLFDEEPAAPALAPASAPAAEEPVVAAASESVAAPAPIPAIAPAPASVDAPAASADHEHNQASPSTSPTAPTQGSAADSAIRVDLGLLDRLMNLVGELVLARNQIVQNTTESSDAAMVMASQRINIITTELQEGVMKTRMQPIGSIWAKFPRIVRDVSNDLGKKVRLEMEGQETELDRTIIEAIKDPLTHIIRNSIDHGIEKPEKRIAAGKAPEGLLYLRAFHEGGQVNIEISDDGAGIEFQRVKAKAVEKGNITAAQAARMSEREALNLIFLPGLSTADKITNVSGRGVGMDVVKTNIEKTGGCVDIQSSMGEGTTLRIKIPLTLAIIPALIITSRGERFAIPQVSLLELVRLEGGQSAKSIEYIFDAPVYRLRGKLLPIVYLNDILKLGRVDNSRLGDDVSNLLVLKAGEKQFGLVVDTVTDTQEIVVKPMGKHLKGLSVFAGATIMGDGRVALILDVFGLAQHAHVITGASESQSADAVASSADRGSDVGARQSLLIFSLGTENRLAMPLSSVGRLEKFKVSVIEREGPRQVVQYRGEIMPLVNLSEVLGIRGTKLDTDELAVVVYRSGDRNLGLVVGCIEDIIEESISLQNQKQRAGILGSAVIHGRVTEMLDIPAIVTASRL